MSGSKSTAVTMAGMKSGERKLYFLTTEAGQRVTSEALRKPPLTFRQPERPVWVVKRLSRRPAALGVTAVAVHARLPPGLSEGPTNVGPAQLSLA